MSEPIYLDHNATTPLAPEVIAAMKPLLEEGWGNPSSSHVFGRVARQAIANARAQVAGLLGCDAGEVVFTGGGTESNNMAIHGVAYALRERGHHIVTSAIEHPAVSQVCAWLKGLGWDVTTVPVNHVGRVDPNDVEWALRDDTVLVSVMHANNETGTIQQIAAIAEIAHARGVLVHSDGAQAVGKIPTRMRELGVDLYSVAGHKLYAPKGFGVLYVRQGTPLAKFMHGADHEGDRRAGTENTFGIAGLGAAAALASDLGDRSADHMRTCRDHLHEAIRGALPEVRLNGHAEQRLPNTLSLAFPGLPADALLAALEGEVAASAGAACHSGEVSISGVLQAMQVPRQLAMGTVRFSTGAGSSLPLMDAAASAVIRAVRQLRG